MGDVKTKLLNRSSDNRYTNNYNRELFEEAAEEITRLNSVIAERDASIAKLSLQLDCTEDEVLISQRRNNSIMSELSAMESKIHGCVMVPDNVYRAASAIMKSKCQEIHEKTTLEQFLKSGDAK